MLKQFYVEKIDLIKANKDVLYIKCVEGVVFSLWLENLLESYNNYGTVMNLAFPFAFILFCLNRLNKHIEQKLTDSFIYWIGWIIIFFELIIWLSYWRLLDMLN